MSINRSRIFEIIFVTLLLFLIVIPTVTNAFSLIEPDKCSGNLCIPKGAKYCTICDGLNVVKSGMEYLIDIGVVVAVLIITYGAILIMVGGAMPAKIQEGRKAITASVVGVILMLMAWIIVNQVFFMFVSGGGITGKPWNKIECPQEERLDCILGPGTPIASRGTSTGRGSTANCETNVAESMSRLSGGGTICNGEGSCPASCDTSAFDTYITKYANGVPEPLIKKIIAIESGCRANIGKDQSVDGKSCGLMQVVSANCVTDPEENIRLGMIILKNAYNEANSYRNQYGNAASVEELTYSIYNGGGENVKLSKDCNSANGFPPIPKWGCPIDPGPLPYNACYIREKACDFGSCFR
ncbi:MAG: transglycosylase SLT domain-containing protein [bacterium]|nr:transglycosylase SLT domain-containing protein [bacterium]